MSAAWSWPLAALSLAAAWLMGSKRPSAWPVTLAVNVVGAGYFWATGQHGFVVMEACFVAMNVRGWLAWRGKPRIGPVARWRIRRDWSRASRSPAVLIDVDMAKACGQASTAGRMLHVADEPHRCKKPHGRDVGDGLGVNFLPPAGPAGSVWRCGRGKLWQAGAGSWFEAGWRTRWRYRRGKVWQFMPLEEIS